VKVDLTAPFICLFHFLTRHRHAQLKYSLINLSALIIELIPFVFFLYRYSESSSCRALSFSMHKIESYQCMSVQYDFNYSAF